MAGQADCLQVQDRSAVTEPSYSHARRCLIWLSRDNRCTRHTAPLASLWRPSMNIAIGQVLQQGAERRVYKAQSE
ncbi:hypothetical protein J6590_007537 [Homalodisca vitripennis]|nr:hypothetical protein J6590_007537 [Homalodisca vitripennis]